jgi:sugar O-acyltransferase (sialic acid O-acetyltransferase NeuD family)
MVNRVAVVASGGYLSEIVGIALRPARGYEATIESVVFVDGPNTDRPLVDDIARRIGVPVLDSLDDISAGTGLVVMAGDGAARSALAEGRQMTTMIHANTTIGPWTTIGDGTVVSPGVHIAGNVTVGRGVLINSGAVLSHDDVVGDFVTLSPTATLCGGVTVGDRSTIYAGATVMPDVTIGSDAVVGAGAMVNRDVPDGTVVAGVPARPIG